jgi:hypothetical protein
MELAHLDVMFASILYTAVTNYSIVVFRGRLFFAIQTIKPILPPNALQPDGRRMLQDIFRKIREESVENA